MNRSWLIVIALLAVTGVVLAFTWHNIPILNTAIVDSGIPVMVADFRTQITDVIGGNGLSFGAIGGILSVSSLAIKSLRGKAQQLTLDKNRLITDNQATIGTLKAQFSEGIATLTGSKDQLKNQLVDFQEKYTTDIASWEDKVKERDGEILTLSKSLTSVQSTLGSANLKIQKLDQQLLTITKEKAELGIAIAEKTIPTSH